MPTISEHVQDAKVLLQSRVHYRIKCYFRSKELHLNKEKDSESYIYADLIRTADIIRVLQRSMNVTSDIFSKV